MEAVVEGTPRWRVLVLEHEEALREVIETVLGDAGFAIALASHGEAALASIDLQPPDALVLDLGAPAMDCRAFVREYLLRTPNPAPIIVLSAMESEGAAFVSQVGVHAFLTKPFDIAELEEVVSLTVSREPVVPARSAPRRQSAEIRARSVSGVQTPCSGMGDQSQWPLPEFMRWIGITDCQGWLRLDRLHRLKKQVMTLSQSLERVQGEARDLVDREQRCALTPADRVQLRHLRSDVERYRVELHAARQELEVLRVPTHSAR